MYQLASPHQHHVVNTPRRHARGEIEDVRRIVAGQHQHVVALTVDEGLERIPEAESIIAVRPKVRHLVELQPEDFLARYNLACSLARAGRLEEAIDALSRAVLLGYDDLDHMESDPDLESLHAHPDFQALLGEE